MQVQKRNGTTQPFDKSKIVLGLTQAGVLVDEANIIADKIEQWLPSQAKDDTIMSIDVRDKVLRLLQEQGSASAGEFEGFEK